MEANHSSKTFVKYVTEYGDVNRKTTKWQVSKIISTICYQNWFKNSDFDKTSHYRGYVIFFGFVSQTDAMKRSLCHTVWRLCH
jgi:hypothetical protein